MPAPSCLEIHSTQHSTLDRLLSVFCNTTTCADLEWRGGSATVYLYKKENSRKRKWDVEEVQSVSEWVVGDEGKGSGDKRMDRMC